MPFKKLAGEGERRAYGLFARAGIPIPRVLGYDDGALTLEELPESSADIELIVDLAADLHAAFWDNYDAFGEIGLPWRLDNPKNFAQHCKSLEKGIRPYCKSHNMDGEVFRQALGYFRTQMPRYMEHRFHAGKQITVLHGDLHPGNVMLTESGAVVFVDLEAVRVGIGAEDLVMLLALHAAPEQASPLLERYYRRLGGEARGCSFKTLLADYRLALAEGLFFPQKLFLSNGIDDTAMMERALEAWRNLT